MKPIFKILLITLLISLNPSSVMAEIKLYLDESRTKHIMVEEQDCTIYKSKDGKIPLDYKAIGLLSQRIIADELSILIFLSF